MKRSVMIWIIVVVLFIGVNWTGIGSYYSGAAGNALVEELEEICGDAYTGKTVDGGTQDMTFVIEPATFFPTNESVLRMLGWDYHYTCTVTFTTYAPDGSVTQVRTITYDGIDPVEPNDARAYLDLDSKQES